MISRKQIAPASKRQLRMIPSVASMQERSISGWGIPFTFRALRVTAPVGCALKHNLLTMLRGIARFADVGLRYLGVAEKYPKRER
jgi:hypothetical protein